MRIVVGVAAAGLVALVVAVLTGNTLAAVAVVILALAGMLLLLLDWRTERSRVLGEDASQTDATAAGGSGPAEQPDGEPPLKPDMFNPDISTDPDGPSSDARAD